MKLKTILILFTLIIFKATIASASPVLIGGYDIAKIANETITILETKGVLNKGEIILEPKENTDALVVAPEFIKFYKNLGNTLIQKKILKEEDVKKVETFATESGGLKSGNQNPVVLAAGYLDILSQKGIVDIPTAQKILNNARP